MTKIVEINMLHCASTGNIMLGIAETARACGYELFTFSPRPYRRHERLELPDIPGHRYFGTAIENACHIVLAKLTGFHGCFSVVGTLALIAQLRRICPDVIHLHNLHGWYINLPLLFRYIKRSGVSVVWTLHDCWAFTGQCPYFTMNGCEKWKTGCHDCPSTRKYPEARVDLTRSMWRLKKKWFTGVKNLTLVTPSQWLANLVKQSFLGGYPVEVINNGIDLGVFKPTPGELREKYGITEKYIVLGVAFGWEKRKGLDAFLELAARLDADYRLVLVGTDENTEKLLPEGIVSIRRTQDKAELAGIYTAADLFVNPTREENFPTVNIEALACGTPVLTFKTGGSPEIIDDTCGAVVDCGDVDALEREIIRICETKPYPEAACIKRALKFEQTERFREYVDLYRTMDTN